MFKIELFDRWPGFKIEGEQAVYGRITFGDEPHAYETFVATFDYWSANRHRRHWREALQRLALDPSQTWLWTWVHDPRKTVILQGWQLWREGGRVFLQNRLIFTRNGDGLEKNFDGDLDMREPWACLSSERAEFSDDGDRINEWEVPYADIEAFLAAPQRPFHRVWPRRR
jgi:hypothetical protein